MGKLLSVTPLLLHGDLVSPEVRAELRAADAASEVERQRHLEAAATLLFREADLGCSDARELVGL